MLVYLSEKPVMSGGQSIHVYYYYLLLRKSAPGPECMVPSIMSSSGFPYWFRQSRVSRF